MRKHEEVISIIMKVKCIAEKGYLFGNVGKSNRLEDISNFNKSLKLNKCYIVYGVTEYRNEINYLIYDENEMATWHYADLFEIEDNILPYDWRCNYYGYDPTSLSFIIGYKELAESLEHYNGLIEFEQKDLDLFWKRKKEIDKMYESEE